MHRIPRSAPLPAIALAALVALAAAGPAAAVDGVIEINQASAQAGNVTPGDTPGFPVNLTQPGSYRLTGNLVVGFAVDAIYVDAEGVSLDLNGFEVVGTNSCSGNPPSVDITCDAISGSIGINAQQRNFTVRNGAVRNFQAYNVYCTQPGCRVENVHVQEAARGISTTSGASITGCTAELHYYGGISTGSGEAGGAVVVGNLARKNGDDGIRLGTGSLARDNIAYDNFGFGIFSNGGSLLNNNVRNNLGGGLRLSQGTVLGNTVLDNGGYGLVIATSNAVGYGHNVFYSNDSGAVSGTGVQLATNQCGTAACP